MPGPYKAAVASSVFPSLGAHLYQTTFKYTDNVEHEATLMDCLVAESGTGKGCIDKPIDHIMADIRERDAINEKREAEWKEEMNTKGANKDKSKRPEGLIIQEIHGDMTNAALVTRTAEAEGHILFLKVNEIQMFDALKGNGKAGHQYLVMCLSFDPNNRYGQTRIGTQSVTKTVCLRMNWNACTTPKKVKKYFKPVCTDGPVQRISFSTIPQREIEPTSWCSATTTPCSTQSSSRISSTSVHREDSSTVRRLPSWPRSCRRSVRNWPYSPRAVCSTICLTVPASSPG